MVAKNCWMVQSRRFSRLVWPKYEVQSSCAAGEVERSVGERAEGDQIKRFNAHGKLIVSKSMDY